MNKEVQTKTQIKSLLERHGVRPRKRHGQNFLIDGNLLRMIPHAAELSPQDVVLEVGSGTGGLTDLLLQQAGRVIAVEIDRVMQTILKERFSADERFLLLEMDALENKNRLARPLLETLKQNRPTADGKLKLVANLPYNSATSILANLLLCPTPPELYCVTIQEELAARFLAKPNTGDYGPISVLFQSCCKLKRVAGIPPTAFWPVPKVSSCILKIETQPEPLYPWENLSVLATLLRGAFAHRRKTLRFNLRKVFGVTQSTELEALADQGFDLRRRPEEFSVEQWCKLAMLLRPGGEAQDGEMPQEPTDPEDD